jgi:midasin (ATPase involved in ribosome maturation)
MKQINYDEIISQLKTELNSECAIANIYGIVLASNIKEFSKGKVIPHKILSLISNSKDIADELNLNKINSFALEAQEYNYLFTFSDELILISKLGLSMNLAKFMPSISVFLNKLNEKYKEQEITEFSKFDFSKEIQKIEDTFKEKKGSDTKYRKKYSIIKDLVKYIATK